MHHLLRFFRSNRIINEGPRSYWQFKYKDKIICLLGENHWSDTNGDLSRKMKQDYIDLFQKSLTALSDNAKIKMLFEIKPGNPPPSKIQNFGFIDCVRSVSENSNLEMECIDDRAWTSGGLEALLLFTRCVGQLEIKSMQEACQRGVPAEKAESFVENILCGEKIISLLRSEYSDRVPRLTFHDMATIFHTKLNQFEKKIDEIENDSNSRLIVPFLVQCYITLSDALDLLIDTMQVYRQQNFIPDNDVAIIDFIINVMQMTKSVDVVARFTKIISDYVSAAFDGTLIMTIWQELQTDGTDIIFAISGDSHISNTAAAFKNICELQLSNVCDNTSHSLTANELSQFLQISFPVLSAKPVACCYLL